MDDQKRFFVAVVLILGFLTIWFKYFVPKPQPKPGPATSQAEMVGEKAPVARPATPAPPVAEKPGQEQSLPVTQVWRETPFSKMGFTNIGGTVTTATLKKFQKTLKNTQDLVEVIPFRGEAPSPLVWTFEAQGQSWRDEHAAYEVRDETKDAVSFSRKLGKDLEVIKTFRFADNGYGVDLTLEVVNRSTTTKKFLARTELSTGTVGAKNQSMFSPGDPLRLTAYANEKTIRRSVKDILKEKGVPQGDISWAGFDSRYFLLAAVPREARWERVDTGVTLKEGVGSKESAGEFDVRWLHATAVYPPREIAAGERIQYRLELFAGPKDIGLLQKAGASLERAIDLGNWIGWIARPMLRFLRWLHGLVPNYGVAIILLTVLVRLLMFPLAQMQAKSMKRMQEHKPQLDALKEKHKDDKEAYSREMMGYMRTHRINPMSGCFMLLPQLPVFFALYRVLYNSIELRHAPFVFWLQDLSAHDPIFVTPILMGIVMFIQQQMTPAPGMDPAQQKMMKIMPVMFVGFMLMLPAGLNLYFFVSTLWGVLQQYWVQRGVSTAVATPRKMKTQRRG